MEKMFKRITTALLNELKGDEALSVSLDGERSHFTRFTQSKIRQTGLVNQVNLGFSLMKDQRRVQSEISLTGDGAGDLDLSLAELRRLRAEVVQLPEDPYLVLPSGKDTSRAEFSGNLLDPEEATEALLPAMQGVDLAGIWASGQILRGVATSSGQHHWFATDTFSLDYSLITPEEKMVKATHAGKDWDQAEYERFMADSIQRLRLMEMPPRKIEPGHYRTYIAPAGVADFLGMFSWGGVSEAAIRQGESALGKMRSREATLSAYFELSEDFRSGLVPRFNGNGEVAPEVTTLISSGELRNTLVSSRTAKEYGVESNFAAEGEGLRAPVMSAGSLKETDVLEALGTGVYLSNLHYLNWSDRIGGRITGMTRYACFWVEDGKIVAPIENMRFDDSIYRFFGSQLEAAGAETKVIPDVDTYEGRSLGGTVCPGILLSEFALTL